MKLKKFLAIALLGGLALTGCDYNEDNFEGLDEMAALKDVQALTYTLTADDYATMASKASSMASGDAVDALKAIGAAEAFSAEYPAADYLPYFLAYTGGKFYTLSNDSSIKVTYNYQDEAPADIQALNAAVAYTLSTDDYKKAWDNDTNYIKALKSNQEEMLAELVPTEELQAGDYVAVTYNYVSEEPTFSPNEFPGSGSYLVVVNYEGVNYAMAMLANESYSYGYMVAAEVKVNGGKIAYDETTAAHALQFTEESAGYTIKNARGQYLYQKGTYNNFNLSTSVQEGAYWSVTGNDDVATYSIVNESVNKTIYYDAEYNSYGSYASGSDLHIPTSIYRLNDEGTAYVDISKVKFEAVKILREYKKVDTFEGEGEYLIVAMGDENYAAKPLDSSKNYGYLNAASLTVTDGVIAYDEESQAVAWTVAPAANEGEYTLLASDGRYIYQTGSYNSFNATEDSTTQGTAWTFTANGDGTFNITNTNVNKYMQYSVSYGSYGSYSDPQEGALLPSLFKYTETVATAAPAARPTAVVSEPKSEKRYVLFQFDGEKLTKSSVADVLQVADYTAMGQKYGNFTNPQQDNYLPQWLQLSYPYAQVDDVKNVLYLCYANKTTSWAADQYIYNGSQWVKNESLEQVTDQFVRMDGKWLYNPSLVLNLLPSKTCELSVTYYQAATDWVWENVDQPMGITTKGGGFVTSYGNNEYYTGCSAYYGNIDLRAGSARSQYGDDSYQGAELVEAGIAFSGDGYSSLADDKVVELMIKRTQYVLGRVIEQQNPDLKPVEGIDVTVTLNVGLYDGNQIASCTHALVYQVVAPGKVEFLSMTEL